jgi:hypothetical protein
MMEMKKFEVDGEDIATHKPEYAEIKSTDHVPKDLTDDDGVQGGELLHVVGNTTGGDGSKEDVAGSGMYPRGPKIDRYDDNIAQPR